MRDQLPKPANNGFNSIPIGREKGLSQSHENILNRLFVQTSLSSFNGVREHDTVGNDSGP